jgi:ATP phosphoribosyltransferase regulatory subunit
MLTIQNSLLPSGFYDLLPPEAQAEADLTQAVMQTCTAYGYERVRPPLLEFEESLLADENPEIARQTFRLLDPLSQKLMGVRADMTMQIGRIAVTRLKRLPRPLRLCYTGTTLHTFAAALKPARQITQAGAELIGVDSVASDLEAITLAVRCLQALGVKGISVDISLPALVPLLLKESGLKEEEKKNLLRALANKDASPIAALELSLQTLLYALLATLGNASAQSEALLALALPEECHDLCVRLHALVQQLTATLPDIRLTLDATENRGFDYYQKGVSFSLFVEGLEGEIGRGGRYQIAFGEGVAAILWHREPHSRASIFYRLRMQLSLPSCNKKAMPRCTLWTTLPPQPWKPRRVKRVACIVRPCGGRGVFGMSRMYNF